MININMNSKDKSEPFLLNPVGKDYLWGGTRLKDDFGKDIDMSPLAETWECSTHPAGISRVASGVWKGLRLDEVLKKNPEYIGTHPSLNQKIPILIKLIDAKQNLSVQVHPDDDYARTHENGSLGKTEMWYVVDSSKNASLVYGFLCDMKGSTVRNSIKNGSIEKYLQRVPVHKGDVFFIRPGQIHAIGAGALIAEIQESSDLTYRMYDYNRTDKTGKKRALQIEKAMEVADLKASTKPRQPMRVLKFANGTASELLCRCKYFQVERILLNTERNRNLAEFQAGSNSFQVLLCVDGCGVMFWNDSFLNIYKGDCIFIPADSVKIKLHGKAQLLKVCC